MTKPLQFEIASARYDHSYRWAKLYAQGYDVIEFDLRVKNTDQFLQTVPHTGLADRRKFNLDTTLYSGQLYIHISNDNRGCIVLSKGGRQAITDFLDKYQHLFEVNHKRSINITYYYMNRGAVEGKTLALDLDKLTHTYPELYPDIDITILNEEFKRSNDAILILYGQPGVGKTTFIKYILDQGDYPDALYVKDINVMKSGDFWCNLTGRRYGVMILDDLDFALSPRRHDEDSTLVTNLLSYSDGIFNQNAKVVITTNQPIHQIDNALMRPGRCFDFLTLEPLTQVQAQEFWTHTLNRPINEYLKFIDPREEHVTQAAIMSAHRRLNANVKKGYMRRGDVLPLEERLARAGVNVKSDKIAFT